MGTAHAAGSRAAERQGRLDKVGQYIIDATPAGRDLILDLFYIFSVTAEVIQRQGTGQFIDCFNGLLNMRKFDYR